MAVCIHIYIFDDQMLFNNKTTTIKATDRHIAQKPTTMGGK